MADGLCKRLQGLLDALAVLVNTIMAMPVIVDQQVGVCAARCVVVAAVYDVAKHRWLLCMCESCACPANKELLLCLTAQHQILFWLAATAAAHVVLCERHNQPAGSLFRASQVAAVDAQHPVLQGPVLCLQRLH
jgi:hypothetical protein